MHCLLNSRHKGWLFHDEQCIRALFTDPQIPLFSNFFIKNGPHNTIHKFKNYFATVFSVFSFSKISSIQTDVYVWIHVCVLNPRLRFTFLFFFFFTRFGVTWLLFMYCSLNSNRKCWLFCNKQCISVLFMDPQIPLFSNFFIKNGSHGTIHTFKNYFATVFSVFSFQFQ